MRRRSHRSSIAEGSSVDDADIAGIIAAAANCDDDDDDDDDCPAGAVIAVAPSESKTAASVDAAVARRSIVDSNGTMTSAGAGAVVVAAAADAAAKVSHLEIGLLLAIAGSQVPSPAQAPPKRPSCCLNCRLRIDYCGTRVLKVLPVASM